MLGNHDAIALPQSTEYAKEMRKWESTHTKFGPPGRQYAHQEYPKMMSRAEHVPGEGIKVVEEQKAPDEQGERNLQSRGFHFGHEKAFAAARKQQTDFGIEAATRNFEIAKGRISENAAAEVRAAEQEHGARHLPVVPEKPRKPRGRPKATATV